MELSGEQVNIRFESSRLLHAYIAIGSEGEVRRGYVQALAAAMLCSENGTVPCGSCRECRKSLRGQHPDIIYVDKPEDKAVFPINTIRDLCADTVVMPNDAARKVYILQHAELMNAAAQNAFLKTLEEPPSYCCFIIPIEDPSVLLPTVRSRCAELRIPEAEKEFDPQALENARAFLSAAARSALEAAAVLASLDSKKDAREGFLRFLDALVSEAPVWAADGRLPLEVWSVLDSALSRSSVYRLFNLNISYISGMLSACLVGIPRKKVK